MTIQSFVCAQTAELFDGKSPVRFRNIEKVAARKLQMLDMAVELKDLRSPPGNRLEPLSGDRDGQYSIRVNEQWRVCFTWSKEGPSDVMIVDYH